jgi:hypothetical protein
MRMLGVVLVACVLSACASGRSDPDRDAEAKSFRPPADKAWIYIVPSSNIASVTVTLDGRKAGTLGIENYLRLEVAPGGRTLSAARANIAPAVFRETGDSVVVVAEAGRCYFLRTAWTDVGTTWRDYRVVWEKMTENEGRREVNVRWLASP